MGERFVVKEKSFRINGCMVIDTDKKNELGGEWLVAEFYCENDVVQAEAFAREYAKKLNDQIPRYRAGQINRDGSIWEVMDVKNHCAVARFYYVDQEKNASEFAAQLNYENGEGYVSA